MDIRSLYRIYQKTGLVDTDTRRIRPGSIFFALKGEHFNGNDFAAEALEKGAAWAVVDDAWLVPNPQFIKVENVLMTLQQLASLHRVESGIRILAITGSNGKTTTKELCRDILAGKYRVKATEGNLNNHIGLPLTLLSMDRTVQVGIVEMGANHPGEIRFLCEIAQPDYGLLTNIGKAHLEGFGGIEGVVRAKGELFAYLDTQGRTLFVNQGDENIMKILPDGSGKRVFYNGDRGLRRGKTIADPFLEVEVLAGNRSLNLTTQLVGAYNVENVLAACCVGMTLDVPDEEIVKAIQAYRPHAYRSQYLISAGNKIFMDAYNANPSSMLAAITAFLAWKEENKMLILGEMKEVGEDAEMEHQHIVSFLQDHGLKDVICIGSSFRVPALKAGFLYFENVASLSAYLKSHPLAQKTVFVKGSRSNRLEELLDLL